MTQTLTQIVEVVTHSFNATVGQPALPLLVVAAYAGCSIGLYGLTKGREFLIAGYSSVLFLVPFIHIA